MLLCAVLSRIVLFQTLSTPFSNFHGMELCDLAKRTHGLRKMVSAGVQESKRRSGPNLLVSVHDSRLSVSGSPTTIDRHQRPVVCL